MALQCQHVCFALRYPLVSSGKTSTWSQRDLGCGFQWEETSALFDPLFSFKVLKTELQAASRARHFLGQLQEAFLIWLWYKRSEFHLDELFSNNVFADVLGKKRLFFWCQLWCRFFYLSTLLSTDLFTVVDGWKCWVGINHVVSQARLQCSFNLFIFSLYYYH